MYLAPPLCAWPRHPEASSVNWAHGLACQGVNAWRETLNAEPSISLLPRNMRVKLNPGPGNLQWPNCAQTGCKSLPLEWPVFYTPSLEPRKECKQISTLHYKYMPTLLHIHHSVCWASSCKRHMQRRVTTRDVISYTAVLQEHNQLDRSKRDKENAKAG